MHRLAAAMALRSSVVNAGWFSRREPSSTSFGARDRGVLQPQRSSRRNKTAMALAFIRSNGSAHRWRPLRGSRIAKLRGGAAIGVKRLVRARLRTARKKRLNLSRARQELAECGRQTC